MQINTPYMGNDAVPLQRRVVPIPYHSQRIGETVCLPPKYTREEVENGNFNTGPVTATATRQDVTQQALAAPAPKKKQEPEPAGEDDQFVEDVKAALAELTSPEEVTNFMQEIRQDADVPQAVLDLGRTRWNELQEQ